MPKYTIIVTQEYYDKLEVEADNLYEALERAECDAVLPSRRSPDTTHGRLDSTDPEYTRLRNDPEFIKFVNDRFEERMEILRENNELNLSAKAGICYADLADAMDVFESLKLIREKKMKLTVSKKRKGAGEKAVLDYKLDGKPCSEFDICRGAGLEALTKNWEKILENSQSNCFTCPNGQEVIVSYGAYYPICREEMTASAIAANLAHKLSCIRQVVEQNYPEVEETCTVKLYPAKM